MSKRKHSKDYGEMTIPLLKQELRLRKAKLSGKKHQLIERLESYNRNDNFGHQLVQFNMNVPEQSGYKDINSETQMPTVTEEQVKIYMDLYGQDLKENSKAMSIWLNSTATNPPIRQMYGPANVYAIANDHNYQDMFLQSIHVTGIE
ncbi:hypothetical protein LSH36_1068g00015 [Paralvinella palmiformis]|uniref:SAP domain-containing protein n=1 Tax=Paralvinella palmiformis TaxID=53620 RepID=A0AAD9IVU1_9ANNE|nr:hypothetical protein LSH36_1068g00015 [Paralvinella palmiformis]